MPSLSVVMAVYNGAGFLRQAIDSILEQTFGDFELLCIEDGSTDESGKILADYAAKDSRIKILRHEKNRGLIASLNEGCEAASADLIARMDADDVALPNRFEKQLQYLSARPDIGALGCAVQLIDGDSRPLHTKSYPTIPGVCAFTVTFFNPMCHPTMVMQKRWIREVGGYNAERIAAEDYALVAELSWRVPITNLPDRLLRYRVWGGNVTSTRWKQQEATADVVVQATVARISGLQIDAAEARALRGLARNDFPKTAKSIERLAEIIETLVPRYLSEIARTEEDRTGIRRDAGTRLLLLAALAARRSPSLAARLTSRALRLSPAAALELASKATERLLKR